MSPLVDHRQAGESTRRVVMRTSLARSFSGLQAPQGTGLKASAASSAFLLFLVLQLAQIDGALGHALQRLAVEFEQVREQPLSTRSTSSSTSMPFLKSSSCGLLFLALRQRIGGDDVDGLLAFLHALHVVGQRHALRRCASWTRSAAASAMRVLVGVVFAQTFLST